MTGRKLRRAGKLIDRIGDHHPVRGVLRGVRGLPHRIRLWELDRICRAAGVDIADELFLPDWAIKCNAHVAIVSVDAVAVAAFVAMETTYRPVTDG